MINEKREPYIRVLDEYYHRIGRTQKPAYHNYSLPELKKCLRMFRLKLVETEEIISADNKWNKPIV